jgi:prepilin-type N-terminal cleavage/methylation domain-containing protein
MRRQKSRKKQNQKRGFSLIELLIVVAVILIIAAIAIPNLLRSRIAANEASAVGSLRTLNTSEVTYNTTYPGVGFACSFGVLGPPSSGAAASSSAAGLIDSNLAGGIKSGYSFAFLNTTCTPSAGVNTSYDIGASPQSPGVTGQRYFCSDLSGVIQSNSATTGAFTDNGGVCSPGTPI